MIQKKMASAPSTKAMSLLTVFRSGQIVAERGFEDVLVSMRCREVGVHTRTGERRSTTRLPRVTHEVRVLRSNLDGSLWSLVEAIPEARSPFDYVASVCRAVGRITGKKPVR